MELQPTERAADALLEITPAMIEAGVLAAELEGYEYGWGEEAELVTRVYRAMAALAEQPNQDA